MELLLIDNYDSFVYNLMHYFEGLEIGVKVVRNDEVTTDLVKKYQQIVISPGPGLPKEAGNLMTVLKEAYLETKILGVCLGHQSIGEIFDYKLVNLPEVLHGVSSNLHVLNNSTIFKNLPSAFKVGHYHSWVIEDNQEGELEVIAKNDKGNVMAIQHKKLPIYGVQFHPESILTENGKEILKNWLEL